MGEHSIALLSLGVAALGVLIGWLGYSTGKTRQQKTEVVEKTTATVTQQTELHSVQKAVDRLHIRLKKVEEEIETLISQFTNLDKEEALTRRDVEQLKTEVSRLIVLHEKLYTMILDLFRQHS